MSSKSEDQAVVVLEPMQLSVNFTDQALQDQLTLRQRLVRFIREHLREGVDYGKIPGTPKPSLYKPGAEKLANLFKLGSRIVGREREIDREGGFAYFSYAIEIFHIPTGKVVAQCEGSANSQEDKYKERTVWKKKPMSNGKETKEPIKEKTPIYVVLNTLQKMAQKRAYVGAVIIATGASDFFTQDLEDMEDFLDSSVDKGKEIAKSIGKPDPVEQAKASGVPICCNREMMIDKFRDNMFYCLVCKRRVPAK